MVNVCVWLLLASPDVSVDSADAASSGLIRLYICMSLTRIHSSKQAWEVNNYKGFKEKPTSLHEKKTE